MAVTSSGSMPRPIQKRKWITIQKSTLQIVNQMIQLITTGDRGAVIEMSRMGHEESAVAPDWPRGPLRRQPEGLHKDKVLFAVRIDYI